MRHILYSFAASLALNGLIFTSLDRVIFFDSQKLEILKKENITLVDKQNFFEFVEAPPVAPLRKPVQAKKISYRDSVAQDRVKEKAGLNGAPKIEETGLADQLAQHQGRPSQQSSPAVKAQQEMKKVPSKPVPGVGIEENRPEQKKQMAQKPQLTEKGVGGGARINTQEMMRTKSKGASLSGMTSFDAMGSDMGIYMKNLKEKVWLAWFPYLAFQYPNDFQAADAVISFTLDPKGEVKILNVVGSYGSPQFATFCMEAIQRASTFGPVPKEVLSLLGKDELEIKFAFHYR